MFYKSSLQLAEKWKASGNRGQLVIGKGRNTRVRNHHQLILRVVRVRCLGQPMCRFIFLVDLHCNKSGSDYISKISSQSPNPHNQLEQS